LKAESCSFQAFCLWGLKKFEFLKVALVALEKMNYKVSEKINLI
jgi:hypothetical protein